MKKKFTIRLRGIQALVGATLLLGLAAPLAGQAIDPSGPLGQEAVRLDGPVDGRFGFGTPERPRVPCLTPEQRSQIQVQLQASLVSLGQMGLLAPKVPVPVLLDWPIQAVGSAAQGFGVHGVSNFVDQNSAFPNQLLDYNCGQRTYDLSNGYNHAGVDIFTWPFPWNWMAQDEVHVIAAASGTIVLKSSGNFDQNCGFGGGTWNAVFVRHEDGNIAWYGHLKNGSLTTKLVGQKVSAGEYLGVVGSSGNSTGPHLHLELYDSAGSLIDPYAGPCNAPSPLGLWLDQRPYFDSAINRLMIGSAAINYPPCPGQEITNEATSIPKGTLGYFTTFYRDQLNTQVSQYKILQPNGTIFSSWSHSSNATHYAASYWWWSWIIPSNAPLGVWTFQVTYEGVTYQKTFQVI